MDVRLILVTRYLIRSAVAMEVVIVDDAGAQQTSAEERNTARAVTTAMKQKKPHWSLRCLVSSAIC